MASRAGIGTLPEPDHSRDQHRALVAHSLAIGRALDAGQKVPCFANPSGYDADPKPRPHVLAALQMGCMRCPALASCRRYVATNPPNLSGVIAGSLLTDRDHSAIKESA